MNEQRPSPWMLGLGMLDMTQEHVRDVQRALPRHYPLPLKAMMGSTILALGAVPVVMDLARRQWLRTWWVGELARRGNKVQHRLMLHQLRPK